MVLVHNAEAASGRSLRSRATASPAIALLAACSLFAACVRSTDRAAAEAENSDRGTGIGAGAAAAPTSIPSVAGQTRPAAHAKIQDAATPVPKDRLIGSRPLESRYAWDFRLGPLEPSRRPVGEDRAQAAEAARTFLEGLSKGRIESADGGGVLEFLLADLLPEGSRPNRWKLGEGVPRPETGWLFPFLLSTPAGRVRGEILVGQGASATWAVELVILDSPEPSGETGSFDPTVRTVNITGR
ncbi:MAG TPA: hypothetical protein VLH39_04215 [Magnetospirillaceae bacterium]|nr:hypothetical protein [Magnetospirillaceae bacterium]